MAVEVSGHQGLADVLPMPDPLHAPWQLSCDVGPPVGAPAPDSTERLQLPGLGCFLEHGISHAFRKAAIAIACRRLAASSGLGRRLRCWDSSCIRS